MKYILYIVLGLAIAVMATLYVGVNKNDQNPSNQQDIDAQQTQTDVQGSVTIKIAPTGFGANLEIWKFQVVFDSHSGSLDEDPMAIATLVDDAGNRTGPTKWEGPGPGGHHREGVLLFAPIRPLPKTVQLNIRDIGGIPERTFRWKTQ